MRRLKKLPLTLAAHIADLPKSTQVEIWFQDEARLGQKNGRTRIWAKKGTRPRLPADQRYENACLFGAICPERGTGAALVLSRANTQAMQLHLDEISKYVARKAHAVVLMDRAGWHSTDKLTTNEFIRRFMLHILPKGFHRIRHYGLLANGSRTTNIERARQLLQVPAPAKVNADEKATAESDEAQILNLPCPACGGGMIIIETFAPSMEPKQRPAPELIDSS